MLHGLVAQDFVNIAKTNAYLLLGSAAPFLIIMSFLMVTVSSLQGPTSGLFGNFAQHCQVLFGVIYEGRVECKAIQEVFWPCVRKRKWLSWMWPKCSPKHARYA